MAAPEEALRRELTCAICLELYRDPYSLRCGHNFCRPCLARLAAAAPGDIVRCPQCRAPDRLGALVANRHLSSIVLAWKAVRQGAQGGSEEDVSRSHQREAPDPPEEDEEPEWNLPDPIFDAHRRRYIDYCKEKYRLLEDQNARIGEYVNLKKRYTKLLMIKEHRDQHEREVEIKSSGSEHLAMMAQRAGRSYTSVAALFEPDDQGHCPSTVVLHGAAGIGKTLTARKIMLDWAMGELFQDRFDYVFYINCRDYNSLPLQESTAEIISFISPNVPLSAYELTRDPEKLLFIIDGFDALKEVHRTEAPGGNVLLSLIRKRFLHTASLLITSRPMALEKMKQCVERFPRYAEILGFSEADRKEYLTKYFGNVESGQKALQVVQENDILFSMCFFPTICWILCTVIKNQIENHEDPSHAPRTTTAVYMSLLTLLLKPHRSLPVQMLQSNLKKVCALAKAGVWGHKVIFEEEEMEEHQLSASIIKSLFINEDMFVKITECYAAYSFTHLTIQEFFAALFYFLKDDEASVRMTDAQNDVKHLLKAYKKSKRTKFLLTVRFLFGLLSQERLQQMEQNFKWTVFSNVRPDLQKWIKREIEEGRGPMCWNLLYFLYETQDDDFVKSANENLQELVLDTFSQVQMDIRVLLFCLKNSRGVRKLHVSNCSMEPKDATAILSFLPNKCCSLWLNNCNLTAAVCEDIALDLRTTPTLTELSLRCNEQLSDEGGHVLLWKGLQHASCNIETLVLEKCGLTGAVCDELLILLLAKTSLRELDLSSNKLKDPGMKKLCRGLTQPPCTIQKLLLNECSLTAKVCADLAEVLKAKQSLTELGLNSNKLGDDGVKSLCEVLKTSTSRVKILRLNECSLTAKVCADLSEVLKTSQSLTELELSGNKLGDVGVRTLCEALKTSGCPLKILRLSKCSLTAEVCSNIAEVLETNHSLTELDLNANKLGENGVKTLCEVLKTSTCRLQALRLVKCGLTSAVCAELSSAFSKNRHLIELDLGDNTEVLDFGVRELCVGLKDPGCTLKRLSLKNCGLADYSSLDISSALRRNKSLEELDLRGNERLADPGVSTLCKELKRPLSTVQKLRLESCSFSDAVCVELYSAFRLNPVLTELNLSNNESLGDSGVRKLCEALEKPNCVLRSLMLFQCGLTAAACADIASLLCINQSLRNLDLGGNTLKDSGVEMLCKALMHPDCLLQTLKLKSCKMTATVCPILASALKTNRSVTELDLGKNTLKDSGVKELCDGLRYAKYSLKSLGLQKCDLTGSSCEHLALVLSKNPYVTELDLAFNDLTDSGVEKLCAGLTNENCRMNKLMLEGCNLRAAALAALCSALSEKLRLEELSLGCYIATPTLLPFQIWKAPTMNVLLQGLKHPNCKVKKLRLDSCHLTAADCADLASIFSTTLTEFHLESSELEDSGMKELCGGLKQQTCKLQRLKFVHCNVTAAGCTSLFLALGVNLSLTELVLDGFELGDSELNELCKGVKQRSANLQTSWFNERSLAAGGCSDFSPPLGAKQSRKHVHLGRSFEMKDSRDMYAGPGYLDCFLKTPWFKDRRMSPSASSDVSRLQYLRELDWRRNIEMKESGLALRLNNCKLAATACQHLSTALSTKLALKELDVGQHAGMKDSGLKQLCSGLDTPGCNLKALRLQNCSLTLAACADLLTKPSLKQLELTDCFEDDLNMFWKGLSNPRCNLQKLGLYDCNIKASAVEDVFLALSDNKSLTELHLRRNKLGESAAKRLCKVLVYPDFHLQTLRLDTDSLNAEVKEQLRNLPRINVNPRF